MYVELKNINKTYGSYQASRNVNFGIEKGKLIGLLGPSGSGKTTILRMIAGLETPDSGEVIIDGKVVNDVPASQRGIGFVFQNYALFRYMTVYDNVAFGLKVQKADKKKIDARVRELIKLVGLEGLEKRYPSQLSGGQIEQKGTPIGVYRNPETAFTASFFGQPSVLKNADDFHTFAQAEGADKIIVRPEFVKISKLDEVEKFKTSVSRGVVERVSFRGDNLELQVRVNNSVITARRSLEKADIREGETVNVFLYRIFALRGDSVQLIENEAVRDDFVII